MEVFNDMRHLFLIKKQYDIPDDIVRYIGGIIKLYYKRNNAAKQIQRAWFVAVTDPRHMICRRRLNREYSDLCEEL